jgi:uncharacterized protein involved in copper resistance
VKSEAKVRLRVRSTPNCSFSIAAGAVFRPQAGLRQSYVKASRTDLVLGVQGLAPYWFEVGAAAFVSTEGDVCTRQLNTIFG